MIKNDQIDVVKQHFARIDSKITCLSRKKLVDIYKKKIFSFLDDENSVITTSAMYILTILNLYNDTSVMIDYDESSVHIHLSLSDKEYSMEYFFKENRIILRKVNEKYKEMRIVSRHKDTLYVSNKFSAFTSTRKPEKSDLDYNDTRLLAIITG